jgi:mannose-1-phosphate guanylyltransferase
MPLFPIAGEPAVMHIMRKAAAVPNMTEIILLGRYAEHEFASFVRASSDTLGLPVRYLQEYTNLGTAGGIFHFRDLICRGNPDAFIVCHGNLCCDFPFEDLVQFHSCVGDGRHSTMLSVKAREDQAHQYGCAVADEKTFEVLHYVEKPVSFVSADINTGIYVLSRAVFATIGEVFNTHSQTANTSTDIQERIMLETDVVPRLTNAHELYMYKVDTFWSQVKTAGSAVYANRHYLAMHRKESPRLLATSGADGSGPTIIGDVWIDPSASIHPTAKLGPNVSIGPNVKIGAGTRIRDAIVLDNVVIREQSCVLNSVIGWNSTIGKWSRVEGLPVNADPNDPSTHLSQRPLFNTEGKLEPNITVLGESVEVADEVFVLHCLVLPHKELDSDRKNEIIL